MVVPHEDGAEIRRVVTGDVTVRLEDSIDPIALGLIDEMVQGHYVILPKGMRMLNQVYGLLEEYIRKPLGFEEVVLPKVAPIETFQRAALLPHWEPHILAASAYGPTKGVDEAFLLDPLQCTIFYRFHQGKSVDVSSGPRRWFDRSGPSYRNEDLPDLLPGVKQREFHRAEFVYLGTREQVIETRERCLGQLERMFQDLGFDYRVVVGMGCHRFEEEERMHPETEEEIPIKDIELFCPGYGFLEVSGNSVLGSKLTSRFAINGARGEQLWSGCSGVGLNRVVYALAALKPD